MSRKLFVNAPIADPERERHDVFQVEHGRITGLGRASEVGVIGRDIEVIDLKGATVVPGLIDAHAHLGLLAFAWDIAADCRSDRVQSCEDIVAVLKGAAADLPGDEWVFGQGEHYQETKLREGRYPDRDDLDKVSLTRPVMFRASYHINIFNSRGLELLGVDSSTPNAPGGRIERDMSGRPTGRVYDMFSALNGPIPDGVRLESALLKAQNRYLACGVTCVGDIPLSAPDLQGMIALAVEERLRLRVSSYPWYGVAIDTANVQLGVPRQYGCPGARPEMRLQGAKLFLDGGLTSGAAALNAPYPGTSYYGELAYDDADLLRIVGELSGLNLQTALHAIGDRALDQAINVLAALPAKIRDRLRFRVEHAGNLFMTPERINQLVANSIIPVPQPSFILTTAAGYIKHLGYERIGPVMPFRTLIDAGIMIPGNSDAIGITRRQHDPWVGMAAAIQRKTAGGDPLDIEQRLSVREALLMYTSWAAYAVHREHDIGALELGRLADFAVLSESPYEAETVKDVGVESTWIGGNRQFKR